MTDSPPKIFPFQRPESELYLNTAYKILYEDDFFLAAEKPAPLPVHRVGQFIQRNLLSLLIRDGHGENLRVVNRLDSETSGIVLCAKNEMIAGRLGLQFQNRTVRKEYQGIVLGSLQEKRGVIDIPIGVKLESGFHRRVPDPAGKPSQTEYEVIGLKQPPSVNSCAEPCVYSLLKLRPVTGRTHQLRVHLSELGHPFAGDKIYIDSKIFASYRDEGWQEWMLGIVKLPRLALHASFLSIEHPYTKEPLEFHSPLPADIQEFWDQ